MQRITLEYDFSGACEQLGAEWQRLAAAHALTPSLLPGWLASTAGARGCLDRVRVRVTRAAGAVEALWPFIDHAHSFFGVELRMRESPGNYLVSYHGPCLVGGDVRANLASLLHETDTAWDVCLFPSVIRGSPLAAALDEIAAERSWIVVRYPGEESPYLPLEGTWDAFLAAKSGNFRYNLRRKERGLAKAGKLTERWFESPDDVDALWQAMLSVESESWKVGHGMAISSSPVEQRYYERLLPFLAEQGALLAHAAYLDGEPVAYSLCYRWRGRIGQMKTSFRERHSSLSPGLFVNSRTIERAFAEGASEFDFLGDRMPHKMHWTDRVRAHDDFYIFGRSVRGRVVGWLKRLRSRFARERQRFGTMGRGVLHRRADRGPTD